jgi:hypothetical protein
VQKNVPIVVGNPPSWEKLRNPGQHLVNTLLVGGAITILKNMFVNGKDDIPYMK